ncbi:hypothetical protein DH2020_036859 [Rehmannia glutinosa]|uniref:Uncharacterized protein n=1 Tax=Rehmannia glutinosa TaxID=99300 RepID=A0ABR0V2J4_REHGL
MDFHSLSRRELQALCKKNKIPANITNVAMAEALSALEIVEGIEEIMQPSQSGTAQSSTESMDMSEVTSPFVPPTAGRSTCRTNVAKQDIESVNPITRTRRTTRKTQVKDAEGSQADAVKTPALMAQTNRKKGQMASACRKMDSQLKECAEEDKKDVLMTPATMGVTSRRRRAEESAVKKVYSTYSTRRSARLAEKNVEMMSEVENEESQLFKKELLNKDGENEEMNLKNGQEDVNELSVITDVDATTMEEKSENEDKSEVVSNQKQDLSIGDEIKLGSSAQEEECANFETEAKMDEEKCDNVPLRSHDVCISEIEITVKNTTEELNTEEGAKSQDDEAADFVENVILESKDNFAVGEFKDVPEFNVTLDKLTELTLQQEATKDDGVAKADSDFIDHVANPLQQNKNEPDEIEILQLEENKKAIDPHADFSEHIPISDVEMSTHLIVKPTCLTPSKYSASKVSLTMKRMTDNKENIGNGSKLVVMEDVKMARNSVEDKLHELSVRKLSKMLKEKLEITKKSSKNENEVLSRPALQALPENRLVDETQN